MRFSKCFLLGIVAAIATPVLTHAEVGQLRLELNTVETVQNNCRMTFLVENKGNEAIESFKLDVVILGADNTMQRRTLIELAPIRRTKTIVRTFAIEQECARVGAILVNDVAACAPGDAAACLDQLALSSRVSNIRIFK